MGRYEIGVPVEGVIVEKNAPAAQTIHPWKTTLRTFVQVGIPTFIAFAALVPEVLQLVLDQFGKQLPDEVRAVLLGIAALITGVAALLTRIMALPKVVEFTRKHMKWLAPDNKAAEIERTVAG
ncbi:membrane protein [Arthrobacter phage NathanVaag]|nr:membrane protein [Arthrobacter phage NathanVaag]